MNFRDLPKRNKSFFLCRYKLFHTFEDSLTGLTTIKNVKNIRKVLIALLMIFEEM